MQIEVKDDLRVSHKELSKLLKVKPTQLKQTIQKYYKHFEDFSFLYESGGDYYLSYPQCELLVLFTVSTNLEARSLFSKIKQEFDKFKQSNS
ncbi:MAG: hypothetical protein WBA52_12930 [Dolichospermum sp.]